MVRGKEYIEEIKLEVRMCSKGVITTEKEQDKCAVEEV